MSTRRGSQRAPTCLGTARHHGRLLATQHIKRRSRPQTPLRQGSRRVTAWPQASLRESRPHPSGGVERSAGPGSQPDQNRPLHLRRKCNSTPRQALPTASSVGLRLWSLGQGSQRFLPRAALRNLTAPLPETPSKTSPGAPGTSFLSGFGVLGRCRISHANGSDTLLTEFTQ